MLPFRESHEICPNTTAVCEGQLNDIARRLATDRRQKKPGILDKVLVCLYMPDRVPGVVALLILALWRLPHSRYSIKNADYRVAVAQNIAKPW